MIYFFAGITIVFLIISFIKDRKKTVAGLRIAVKKAAKIIIPITLVLLSVSLVLFFIPGTVISAQLSGDNKYISLIIASLFGSVTLMPGFIAFPLSGILWQNGVPYMVISGFTSTLMMVGVMTFPIEKKYFGTKVAVLRNILSFFIALIVSFVTGIVFGEIFS
jgi:uncharacterized membrane protein YraQ (UPF0718 family)